MSADFDWGGRRAREARYLESLKRDERHKINLDPNLAPPSGEPPLLREWRDDLTK